MYLFFWAVRQQLTLDQNHLILESRETESVIKVLWEPNLYICETIGTK